MISETGALYGALVVRLSDRVLLSRVNGAPTTNFTLPDTVWAELVNKCATAHFRTSAFIGVTRDSNPTEEVQLSYHIMTDDSFGYGVVASKDVSRRAGHAALDEIAALFRKMFIEAPNKLTIKIVDVFARPCRDVLVRLSNNTAVSSPSTGSALPTDAKVKQVKLAVDEVKNLALDNVERVIQRGQRIDDIVQATDELQFQAQGFQRSSRDLRNQLW
uniref:Vesicle-associated membrane protein 7 n=1 Tax=Lygus hesperus TaxID=30085 RepID=A0A0A9WDL2_LYGHE